MVKRMNSKEVLKMLKAEGWVPHIQKGSHLQLKHPTKTGKVTIPMGYDPLAPKTLLSICRQAKIKAPR